MTASILRFASPDDAEAIRAIYGPYCESTTVSFEIVAPTLEQMRERIARISASHPWLVAEADGKVAGYVYATQHRERAAYRWMVDVAVYVAQDYQRRSLGRILYKTLFSILRHQGFFKAFAGITLPNPASQGLHESVGFKRIGAYHGVGFKAGRWLDVGWWQLELQPEIAEPREPRPFHSIAKEPEVLAALAAAERQMI